MTTPTFKLAGPLREIRTPQRGYFSVSYEGMVTFGEDIWWAHDLVFTEVGTFYGYLSMTGETLAKRMAVSSGQAEVGTMAPQWELRHGRHRDGWEVKPQPLDRASAFGGDFSEVAAYLKLYGVSEEVASGKGFFDSLLQELKDAVPQETSAPDPTEPLPAATPLHELTFEASSSWVFLGTAETYPYGSRALLPLTVAGLPLMLVQHLRAAEVPTSQVRENALAIHSPMLAIPRGDCTLRESCVAMGELWPSVLASHLGFHELDEQIFFQDWLEANLTEAWRKALRPATEEFWPEDRCIQPH